MPGPVSESYRGPADRVKCWCGAEGWDDEMFSEEPYERDCGGTARIACYCGGDTCVCHWHGEAPCDGCDDCEDDDMDAPAEEPQR